MKRQRIYSAGQLSRAITRKLTISNLAIMLVLFAMCIAALNAYATQSTNQRTDAELERRLEGFTNSHLSPEEHSQRLPSGLLPIIYFRSEDDGFVNPHPSNLIVDEDVDALLARSLPEGFSTQSANGRTYRILRDTYDPALLFWEQKTSFIVSETVSIQDITSETTMLHSLQGASVLCLAISALLFAVSGYALARQSLAPINRAWEKQRSFAADTSHELRNPLAVIQTNAELLLHHPDSRVQDESERVAAILDSSDRMSSMLATLLTLARADANEDEIGHERMCLSDVLRQTCTQFAQIGAGRSVTVTYEIESDVYVMGDRTRLAELFSILLDNAIRYTKPGGVVRATCTRTMRNATVTISDSGIGMSPNDRAHAFQRFYRGDGARNINPEGTGLGLPIAQWIAERHNAEMSLESKEGSGTIVAIVFPKI